MGNKFEVAHDASVVAAARADWTTTAKTGVLADMEALRTRLEAEDAGGDVDLIAGVIGKHYDVVFFNGVWCCSCLQVLANHEVDARLRRDAHLARMIAPLLAAARADAEGRLGEVLRVLAVFETWTAYNSRDTGEVFDAGSVRDLIADVFAVLDAAGPREGEL